jgi:hypothetical protein
MRGVIGKKKSFGLKSKIPLISDRFRPNLHCLYRGGREWHVWRFSYTAATRGEKGSKTLLASRVKCPSLPTDFDQIRIASSAWEGSLNLMFQSPHWNAEQDRDKNCFDNKSKASFIADRFRPKPALLIGHEQELLPMTLQSSRWNARQDRTRNCFGLSSKLSLVTGRFDQTCIVYSTDLTLRSARCNARRIRDEKLFRPLE